MTNATHVIHAGAHRAAAVPHYRAETRTIRRGRAGLDASAVLWMILLAAIIIGVGLLPTVEGRLPSAQTSTIAVRVSQADTLWSIAASHRLPGVSTSQMVRIITEANSLSQGGIRAGSVLNVPVVPLDSSAYAQAGGPSTLR